MSSATHSPPCWLRPIQAVTKTATTCLSPAIVQVEFYARTNRRQLLKGVTINGKKKDIVWGKSSENTLKV